MQKPELLLKLIAHLVTYTQDELNEMVISPSGGHMYDVYENAVDSYIESVGLPPISEGDEFDHYVINLVPDNNRLIDPYFKTYEAKPIDEFPGS